MRKSIYIFFMLLFGLSVISAAACNIHSTNYNIPVVLKNPTTWLPIENSAQGNVMLTQDKYGFAIIRNAKPFTSYTLIYYGDKTHNDVWPYATCISSGATNKHGNVRTTRQEFDYSSFTDDGIDQKFWIVESADVDCTIGRMVAWNPINYLFERHTI